MPSAATIGQAPAGYRSKKGAYGLSLALSVILGLFFLVSGIGKLLDVGAFVETVRAYGIPRRLAYGALFLPPLEILLGIGLLLPLYNRRLAAVAGGLIVLFTLGFAYAHFVRGVSSCGCMGVLSSLETSPLVFFIRNVFLLGAAVFLWMRPVRSRGSRYAVWQVGLIACVAAVAFTASGMSTYRPLYAANQAEEDPYLSRPLARTPLGPWLNASPDSSYLVLLYSVDCSHCLDAMENVKAYQRTGTVDRVIGLTHSPDSARVALAASFDLDFETRSIPPQQMASLTNQVPVALYVHGGVVRHVMRGQVASPFNLRRHLLDQQQQGIRH